MMLTTALFAAPLTALMLATGGPLVRVAQETVPKAADLVITSTAGRDLFQSYCSACRRDGKGNGSAATALKSAAGGPYLARPAQSRHGPG
jgi:mono/diheme cytochrome c family protein